MTPETLRCWVYQTERDEGLRPRLKRAVENSDDVEYAALEWVDWFNNRRLLESIGDIPPAEYETNYWHGIDRNGTVGLTQKVSAEHGEIQSLTECHAYRISIVKLNIQGVILGISFAYLLSCVFPFQKHVHFLLRFFRSTDMSA